MSSSTQSSSSLPVDSCTASLLDFNLQEKVPPYSTELRSKNIDSLMQKLNENETQNTNLRRKILEREKYVKELSSKLQLEKVNVQKDHLSRSVKAVQAHLQCQIQRKEVENDELKMKIQILEKKIADWKLQVGEYKHQMLTLKETSEQKNAALKKAVRSQKQRAQHFEAAVENLIFRIREHEVKLSEITSASDVWKNQLDRVVKGKRILEIQTEDLKKQITSLWEDLKRKEEWRRNWDEEILGQLNSVNSENEKIYLENEQLKASLATLENSTVSVEKELLNLQETAKLQENLVEQYKNQVQELQTAVEELKSRSETVLSENKIVTEGQCLEVHKVRDKIEPELKELEHVCDLLKAAEKKQHEYQEKLMSWETIHAQKCKTRRELQLQCLEYTGPSPESATLLLKVSAGTKPLAGLPVVYLSRISQISSTRNELSFSLEEDSVTAIGSYSLEEENWNIQKKYEDLKRQLEKKELQNEELACRLRKEDESLQCSTLQLELKIAEYNGLTRQLESALEEGRRMVAEELEKMSYREQVLQAKMLILETEVREGQKKKKQLLCIFHHDEKHHEVCLKELENSLQRSENKNQSIQNYVQFLKASYITMFG